MSVRGFALAAVAALVVAGSASAAAAQGSSIHVQAPAGSPPAQPPQAAPATQVPQVATKDSANPLAARVQVPPVLRFMQSQGVKLTLLGTEGGVTAYLGESPNGSQQVFYVMPGGEHLVAGLMFGVDGTNITGIQLGELQRRFDAVQKAAAAPGATPDQALGGAPKIDTPPLQMQLEKGAEKKKEPEAAPAATSGAKPASENPAPAVVQDKPAAAAPAKPAASSPTASSAPTSAPVLAPTAEKYVSPYDRGAVERALADIAWFKVGAESAPIVYMVADPQCPFCHAAWARMKDAVFAKKLQVRVILIAGLKGSLPLAISILSQKDPGSVWLSGQGSQNGVQVDPPPAETSRDYANAQNFLALNSKFVNQFGITQTPTLMYIGKDERLYSSSGLPEDSQSFLAALY